MHAICLEFMTIDPDSTSTSGIITSSFENISDSFTAFSEIPSRGFNRIYKAKRHGQWFVLKGLKPEYQQDILYKEMLSKEFDLAMQLNHPHIAQIFYKESNHPVVGPCLVMEYVDGCTLKEFLKQNPPRRTRLKIAREILSALSYFHSLQIIHRDLKPENILITHNGNNVKIIDFGLADSDSYTFLKQPAGSNKYMPPEQISGDLPLDCRADIYAFGIILRQLFPNEFGAISRKATQPNRERRFDNAEEIVQRLQRCQQWRILMPILILLLCGAMGVWGVLHFSVPKERLLITEETAAPREDGVPAESAPEDTSTFAQNAPVDATVPAETEKPVARTYEEQLFSAIPDEVKSAVDFAVDTLCQPYWSWHESVKGSQEYDQLILAHTVHWQRLHNQLPQFTELLLNDIFEKYPQCKPETSTIERYYGGTVNKEFRKMDSIYKQWAVANAVAPTEREE